MRIFLTGATGAMGRYLLDALLAQPQAQLYLLARSPEKLPERCRQSDRVHVVTGSLERIGAHRELLAGMDSAFHAAVAWGGPHTRAVNVDATLELFSLLPACRQIFYFSTASILGTDHRLLPEALTLGTEYIRSKALCYQQLQTAPYRDRVTVLYPTVVLGGGGDHPWTHASLGLQQARRWIPWLRLLRVDGCFHFIHAADIAAICACLLQQAPGGELVLGNPAMEVNAALEELAVFYRQKRQRTLALEPWLPWLKWGLRAVMSDWDRFCLDNRWLRYRTVHTGTYGLPSAGKTLTAMLTAWGA